MPVDKEQVIDYVEKRVQSKNQATDEMIRYLQSQQIEIEKSLMKNEQNAIDNRKVFKDEMMVVIERSIQVWVNGKIDKANKEISEIKVLLEDIKPMIAERIRRKHFWEELRIDAAWVKWLVGVVGALVALKYFAKDVIKYLIQ